MKSGKAHHVSFTSPIVSDIENSFNLDSVTHRFVRTYCVLTIFSLGSNKCVHVENRKNYQFMRSWVHNLISYINCVQNMHPPFTILVKEIMYSLTLNILHSS